MSYKENLHVSVKQTGLRTSKERDDLEIFFNDITSSKADIIESMKKDIKKFLLLPEVFYSQTITQKKKYKPRKNNKNNPEDKVKPTRKKPRRNSTAKK
jgi:hypothetical protein|tara:strand:- start:3558 stop:3851 length:294 start_codon:yes stop_codon:yes gene_type:complete